MENGEESGAIVAEWAGAGVLPDVGAEVGEFAVVTTFAEFSGIGERLGGYHAADGGGGVEYRLAEFGCDGDG